MSTVGNLVVNFLGNAKPLQGTIASVKSMVSGMYGSLASIIGTGVSLAAAKDDLGAQKKLSAVLASTGAAAGLSAIEIREFATQLQNTTNFADETTVAAAALLSTFRSIKGDMFKETLTTAQDLATVLDIDLNSATMKLGKALQDPISGLGSLHKLGISFTEQQKEMIKSLVESGDTLGAQKMILDSIKGSYAGAAQAMASPFKLLENTLNEIGEEIGKTLLVPMRALAQMVIPFLQQWGQQLAKVGVAILALVGIMRAITLVQKAIAIGQALILALGGPAGWAALATGAALFAGSLVAINSQFGEMQRSMDAAQAKFADLAKSAREMEKWDKAIVGPQAAQDQKKQENYQREFGPAKSIMEQIKEANAAYGGQAPWFVQQGIIEKASGIAGKIADLTGQINILKGVATETDLAIAKMWSIEGLPIEEKKRFEQLMREKDALEQQKKIMEDMTAEAKRIFEGTRTPLEVMEKDVARINELFDKGLIDATTRDRAIDKAQEDFLRKSGLNGEKYAGAAEAGSGAAYSSVLSAMATKNDSIQQRILDAQQHHIALAEEQKDLLQDIADHPQVEFVAGAV